MSHTWNKVRIVKSLPTNAKEVLPGLYVTPEGEVYTVKRYINQQKKTDRTRYIHKRVGTKKNGYQYVIHNSKKSHLVHRLVSVAFIPNPEKKPHVNHRDGNKLNNTTSNLEWVTRSENELHAHSIGLKEGPNKKPVIQMDLLGGYVKEHASITEAVAALGLPITQKTNVTLCCRGKLKTSCGFRWAYA